MPVDAILFDKDGTLFDFAATWVTFARNFLLKVTDRDLERSAALGRVIGFDLAENRFEPDGILVFGTPGEIAEALHPGLPHLSPSRLVDLINEEAAATPQAPAVPLAPFLDLLKARGLRLGVATNDAEAPARVHLEAAGIRNRFDFIAGFDSGHGAKPEPGQLLAFAAHVGVDPARVAMVGDSAHDLVAGRVAGMRTIGVLTGIAGADVLSPLADVVLPDIGHIPAWLDG